MSPRRSGASDRGGARRLTLARSWDTRVVVDNEPGETTDRETVEGYPRVGPVALDALRHRVHDVRTPASDPIRWWHTDGTAWAAVTDLHRRDEHGEACSLALLLRWCEQHYTHEQVRVWTLHEGGSA